MQQSEELKQKIIEMYNKMNNISYMENFVVKSKDFIAIGTDEAEWFKGSEMFLSGMKKQAEVIPDAKVIKCDPNVFVEGNVAWFNDNVTLSVNNSEVKTRNTGVFHKEGGKWKLVQAHVSIGMPNADTAFGNVNIVD